MIVYSGLGLINIRKRVMWPGSSFQEAESTECSRDPAIAQESVIKAEKFI